MSFDGFTAAERTGWDRRAAVYGATTARATTQAIPALLAGAGVAAGRRVIDVCCGPGYAAGAAAAIGAEAMGIDAAPAMVAAARAAFPACRFEIADATSLPAPEGCFDAAICSFGLFHLADPAAALAEMHRVLRPGGRLAASQWSAPPASAFFRVVFGGIGAHADMTVVPEGPPPFALSTAGALDAALTDAGFRDVTVFEVPVVFEAPAAAFPDHFRDFSVRGSMILERQTPETRARIEAAWRDGFAPFEQGGTIRAPMPALVASGRKA
ncbi:methyltransferase domain-containing protein [Limibaculum sp. FT325]|uniref:class I SAM-dependent methyltransferase n=1 Tax=Thermohalobaculum sediminis TaxID=2939436 RepID=UPI0020BDDC94|nr:class I SAM-dependent methyltransferase [Limibaculum sediminis]MCL5779034.1 methyltransferase domain-containing protein [Limibaculum sediminis]